ncbi:MAG: SDR family oxidoreductase [Bradyrhizobiaceae bacterium]|nr:SDR family oxidoreductase [Bradyrhizobiaceae bacterium]
MNAALAGRVAIVTGAARNIGRAIAMELAHSGASIAINARHSAEEATAVAQEVEAAGGKALVQLADVSDPAGAALLIDATAQRFGRIDILINNAAIRRETAFGELNWKQWRAVCGVILDGAYLCAHAALPHLRKSDRASIVNIGGMSAHSGSAGRAHVIAAKAGLVGLTRALAHDLGPDGITVNCVAPGLIDTARDHSSGGTPAHHAVSRTLLGRRGEPDEIAAVVAFLCGPGARYITGQTLHANGGAYLC